MIIAVLAAIAGGLLMLGWPDSYAGWLAAPLDQALTALIGTVANLTGQLIGDGDTTGATIARNVAQLATPGIAAIGIALVARAGTLLRRIAAIACLLVGFAAYTWMDGIAATVALAGIGLVGALVAFGTRWLVTAPLALLSGALVVRTFQAVTAGTSPTNPGIDLTGIVGVGGSELASVTALATLALSYLIAAAGFVAALRLWRRT